MVMPLRACKYVKENGTPCRAAPLVDDDLCYFHSPTTEQERAESRRLGGLRRRRERMVAETYDLEGLETVAQIRRVVTIATLDSLSLENSVSRNRALLAAAGTATKLLETGEHEERLAALEQAVQLRRLPAEAVFDQDDAAAAFEDGDDR